MVWVIWTEWVFFTSIIFPGLHGFHLKQILLHDAWAACSTFPPCILSCVFFSSFFNYRSSMFFCVSLLGVVVPDSSKDLTPCPVSSAAPTTAPPPPPPKNAARMLALALAESAQQVSIQSHSQSSEPLMLMSPPQPQETSDFQDLTNSLAQTSTDKGEGRESCTPPNSAAPAVIPASYPIASSPPVIKQQPPELPSTMSKPSDSAKSSTAPPGTQPETDSTSPNTPISVYKCAPLPSSTSLAALTSKSRERQQPVAAQIPVNTTLSNITLVTSPGSSCKDTVLPQSLPEVSHRSFTSRLEI